MINDLNTELMTTYRMVKDEIQSLVLQLNVMERMYERYSDSQRADYFYRAREKFNEIKKKKDECPLELASLFIFLNKTCFNGLYRVNSKGLFNAPFNKAKKPLICDEENLWECSRLLQDVQIIDGDYRLVEQFIDADTFVYVDPPYRKLSGKSSFTSYSAQGFTDCDQVELAQFCKIIVEQKGARVVVSNSDPHNVDQADDFFEELYKGFRIDRVPASRMINCNGQGRGVITELLICGFGEMKKAL